MKKHELLRKEEMNTDDNIETFRLHFSRWTKTQNTRACSQAQQTAIRVL